MIDVPHKRWAFGQVQFAIALLRLCAVWGVTLERIATRMRVYNHITLDAIFGLLALRMVLKVEERERG
jgi:hypothetical protein